MDSGLLEKAGAISMPQKDHYVVHRENLPAVLSQKDFRQYRSGIRSFH
jgi:hypothetical protein